MKWLLGLVLVWLLAINLVWADIVVEDDLGRKVILNQSAKRIISLAPHLTEMVYAVGAGDSMVATVAWSDYPESATLLPVIGSNNKIDYEAVLLQKPDLALVWRSGNGDGIIKKLASLGIPVYVDEPHNLNNIPAVLIRLGRLTGKESEARQVAEQFRNDLAVLEQKYSRARPVDVYYQIWQSPLITFGGNHLVSDVLRLCGATNVFAAQEALVPRISVESVIAADPEAIVIGQYTDVEVAFSHWRQWQQLKAVKKNNLFGVNPYLLHRHTPRILQGAEELCSKIEQARQ